jgi:membrane-bound metal-dependent hydrolase YbcI (DUF457 family)
MRGREHISIGAGSTALVLTVAQMNGAAVDPASMGLAIAVAAAGSLGPDLDHPGSLASLTIPLSLVGYSLVFLATPWIARQHPALVGLDLSGLGQGWHVAAWTALIAGVVLFILSWVLGAAFGHRGPVHSLAFGAAASAVVLIILAVYDAPLWMAAAFAWGWIAHLIADSTTTHGLQHVFWPIGGRSL